ncbi:MAG: zinc-ribbon domain-containing protein, partial [Candidatus Kariarchaeaceae archaeon]
MDTGDPSDDEAKFCSNCGNPIKKNVNFCSNCGISLVKPAAPQNQQQIIQPP